MKPGSALDVPASGSHGSPVPSVLSPASCSAGFQAFTLPSLLAAGALVWDPDADAAAPKRVALLLVLALALSRTLAQPSARVHLAPSTLGALGALAGLVAWAALGLLRGAPAGTLDVATMAIALGAAALAAARPAPDARALARHTAVLALAGLGIWTVGSALLGVRGHALSAGQGNPNWLGLPLAVALPLALPERIPRGARGILGALAGALALVALGLSHARSAWAGAALGLGCALAIARPRGRVALGLVVSGVLALGAGALAWRAHDSPAGVALGGRVHIARAALAAARDHLPLGAGTGRFSAAYLPAQGRLLAALEPAAAAHRFEGATTAHDDLLHLLVEGGPLAAALFAALLALGLRAAVRARAAGPAGALAAFSLASLGDDPLLLPPAALLLGLALGAATAQPLVDTPPAPTRLPPPRALALAALVAIAALLPASLAHLRAVRARTAAERTVPPERTGALARALALDDGDAETWLAVGLDALDRAEPAKAFPALERSRALLASVAAEVATGHAHVLAGEPAAAESAYRRALALHPGGVRARAGLAEALRRQGRLDEARVALDVARRLSPGHPRLADLAERIASDTLSRQQAQ